MKKAWVVFVLGMLVLCGAVLWEYVFDRRNQEDWVGRFEKNLHDKEREADEILAHFTDSVSVSSYDWEEDVIFVGFRSGKIFFWTNEVVGMDGLYERLNVHENFLKINNAFYEVRKAKYKNLEYYALLHIKDSYPYSNRYIRNRFGKFLDIGIENADNIQVSRFIIDGGESIRDKDGKILCYIGYSENYKDRSANYLLIVLYLLVFCSFFYIFNHLLEYAGSLRKQMLFIICFVLFLMGLRYLMLHGRIPGSLYRLAIFDNNVSPDGLVISIGDLLLSAFSIIQVLYISFVNLKINYQSIRVKRMRYLIAAFLLVMSCFYILFFNHSVRSLIDNTGIYLNMAQVVDIDVSSIIAFVVIIMGGMGIIIIIDGSVSIFRNLFSLSTILLLETVTVSVFILLLLILDKPIGMWGGIFVWVTFVLSTLNRYVVKKDVQRSVYMLIILCLSVYIVLVCKKYEQYRELTQRLEYSTELIEERDYNFEKKLQEISERINDSEVIADLVANYNEEFLKMCLTNDLLELNGYNYISDITLCRAGDSLLLDSEKMYECHAYFGDLLRNQGIKIPGTDFYALNDFDGFTSYIGIFQFGEVTLYLRFDSTPDSEGSGYPQILSRKSIEGENIVYPYSFAKYKNGQLIYSSGKFSYYKSLERFGEFDGAIKIVGKDHYSHMLIPVEENGVLVMSLHDSIFSFYYMNVLYAFFVCMLLSTYGFFFNLNNHVNFRRGTLKARIKNSILFLIFFLFVLLTALSIYLNMKSFENRHNSKATEFLKYVNKELERLECVEYQKCPAIMDVLTDMSEVLQIDINIYSSQGMLVATSRPEIFQAGFDGYLVNAMALEQIVHRGSMGYVGKGHIGEVEYIAAYMPLVLENGDLYILNVPYFTQNDELNIDIVIMVIIATNIAIMIMVLAFVLSGIIAERVMKPLQLVNNKLKAMRIGGKNEKIEYHRKDEIGSLVKEYNEMVEKLEDSINQLAKSERETAWREMARQIAHEVKNPLTPMKLNIQFLLRSLQIEDPVEFKKRFKEISGVLIEQIDNMASIASAFSDFSKISVSRNEIFSISDMMENCVTLFENNVAHWECDIESGIRIFAGKEQIHRVLVNVLKNAEQSIPEGREGKISVTLKQQGTEVEIRIRDNGTGIPAEICDKIFEPNFTTKNSGTGLGLAISRRIVESMGGKIGFTTSAAGTEFYIVLPCEPLAGKGMV